MSFRTAVLAGPVPRSGRPGRVFVLVLIASLVTGLTVGPVVLFALSLF